MDIASYTRHYAGAWGESIAWAYFRMLHNSADLNLAPSSASVRQIRRHGYRRVRWWRRGVELERFRPELRSQAMRMRLSDGNPDQLLAVYVGRLSREKGVDRLRDPLLATPGVRLALIGGGPEAEQIRTHFAGTPTVFTGFLRGDELVEAYASADVLVFPSTSETFGMAPLEAMACGLPVIGTLTGGLVDTLRNGINALTYDPAQPHEIAGHLQRLRDDPARLAQLRAGALAWARARPWQHTMDQLIDLYRLAIRLHRRHRV
jgi:glycosyltransferase involved in cell wall biosynthesis